MTKKDYSLELKGLDSVIIKTNRGQSHYYPYNQMVDYLEVSGDIDRDKVCLKSEWRNPEVIEYHYRLMRNESDSLANWQGLESAIRYSSEESIDAAKKLIEKTVRGIKKTIKTGKLHPAYTAMESIAKKVIKHYFADFSYSDTIALAQMSQDVKFIWIIRNSGTWLITGKSEFTAAIVSEEIKQNQYRSQDDKHFYYFWNGYKFKEIELSDIQQMYNSLPA